MLKFVHLVFGQRGIVNHDFHTLHRICFQKRSDIDFLFGDRAVRPRRMVCVYALFKRLQMRFEFSKFLRVGMNITPIFHRKFLAGLATLPRIC